MDREYVDFEMEWRVFEIFYIVKKWCNKIAMFEHFPGYFTIAPLVWP